MYRKTAGDPDGVPIKFIARLNLRLNLVNFGDYPPLARLIAPRSRAAEPRRSIRTRVGAR